VKALNSHARRPDLTIVLDIPPEVSERRRMERNIGREIFDDGELQAQFGRFYKEIDQHFPGETIVHVDSNRPQPEVAADVFRHVRIARGEKV
jgi:dTMP kinase